MKRYKIYFRLTVLIFLLLTLQQGVLAQIKNESRLDSAKALLMENKYDETINLLNNILIEDSSNVNAYYYLNVCYQAKSKYQKAVQTLSKALKYKPGDIKINDLPW